MSPDAGLVAQLECALPSSLPAGRSNVLFLRGFCFHPRRALVGLEILADGIAHAANAFAMRRPDVAPRGAAGHRSGFWATVPVAARAGSAAIEIELAARLNGGGRAGASLGRIDVSEEAARSGDGPNRGGTIAVCMATFDPDPELFAIQVESLRRQTDTSWICLVSDDCSDPEHFVVVEETIAGDARFRVSRAESHHGFYRNFERALSMVGPEAPLVALCDQDDRWHPDKLTTLRAALGDAVLAYSDQRLVDDSGCLLRDSLWEGRANNHTSLASMMVANTVTGAAALFRRELLETALPFPDTPGSQFHDQWLGFAALAVGDIAYVDRPLYDYTQHSGAVFAEVTDGPGGSQPHPYPRLTRWRAAYFHGYLPRRMQAELLLARSAGSLAEGKRRTLERFVACESSPPALAWLAARSLRVLAGRSETLGSELGLVRGILWRWLAGGAPGALDAAVPPFSAFEQPRMRRWRARFSRGRTL